MLSIATYSDYQASGKEREMFERSGVWYTCIRYKGRKVQRRLGVKVGKKADERLARNIEAKIRTEIVEGSYFKKLVGSNKTFMDMMRRFLVFQLVWVRSYSNNDFPGKTTCRLTKQ